MLWSNKKASCRGITVFDKNEIQSTYGRIAKRYDALAKLLGLIGFREAAHRKRAVAALQLKPGDTVVEIGFRYMVVGEKK